MKFVALVSGGKDSCFNILHCLAQGHQLVALANLHPEDELTQELDSFMFQTVGHDVLEYYSECCEVPMYRQAIKGGSQNQSLEYFTTENDEIEDLYALLLKVKQSHPDVEAVSVGAILSSYQRTRVEHVCQRLGLISLAYLWQRDQLELMSEMCESGLDAKLIKVAAIGLDERHLLKSIQEMLPIMINLNNMYDVHICGEGGEFETLVFDAPFFKRKKLEITGKEIFRDSGDVCYAKVAVKVVAKKYEDITDWGAFVKIPAILSEKFQEIYNQLDNFEVANDVSKREDYEKLGTAAVKKVSNKTFISNISSTKENLKEQVTDVFAQLKHILITENLSFEGVQSIQLLISSMEDFSLINSIYAQYFEAPLPPSRICVETILPSGILLQLSATVLSNLQDKKGFHIQGRSYWAPSNIGPYSQSIIDTKNKIATISGQIPLIPSSMELSLDPKLSTVMSLQHFHVVKELIGAPETISTVAFITSDSYLKPVLDTWEEYEERCPEALIVVKVTSLPKNAGVEWGGMSFAKKPEDSDGDDENDEVAPMISSLTLKDQQLFRQVNGETFDTMFLNNANLERISTLTSSSDKYHFSVYGNPAKMADTIKSFVRETSSEFVPTLSVWDHQGEEYHAAVVIRSC